MPDERGFDAEAWGVELAFLGGTPAVLERVADAAEILERACAGRDPDEGATVGHLAAIAVSLRRASWLLDRRETTYGWLGIGRAMAHADILKGSASRPFGRPSLPRWAMQVGDLFVGLSAAADGCSTSRAAFGPADAVESIERQAAALAEDLAGG